MECLMRQKFEILFRIIDKMKLDVQKSFYHQLLENLIAFFIEFQKKLESFFEELVQNKETLISSLEASSENHEILFSFCEQSKRTLSEKLELHLKQKNDFQKKNVQILKIFKAVVNPQEKVTKTKTPKEKNSEVTDSTKKTFKCPRDKAYFENHIKPFSTLRDILSHFVFPITKKHKVEFQWSEEEFDSTKKQFSQKFENILAQLQQTRRFPEEVLTKTGKRCGNKILSQKFNVLVNKSNPLLHFEEYMKFYNSLNSDEEDTKTVHKFYLQRFQLMMKYLVKPFLINYFNQYSDLIFEHLGG